MAKITLAVFLFISTVPAFAAIPRHINVVGGCNALAQDAADLFEKQGNAPAFDLYVICNYSDWHALAVKNDFTESNISFTVLHKGMIWLGPKALTNPAKLREAIRHELEHLRCDCDLGE